MGGIGIVNPMIGEITVRMNCETNEQEGGALFARSAPRTLFQVAPDCFTWLPCDRVPPRAGMRYARGVGAKDTLPLENPGVGLCAGCLYARRIESARGSLFYLCEKSAADPKYPKYPRLPVIRCTGYASKT